MGFDCKEKCLGCFFSPSPHHQHCPRINSALSVHGEVLQVNTNSSPWYLEQPHSGLIKWQQTNPWPWILLKKIHFSMDLTGIWKIWLMLKCVDAGVASECISLKYFVLFWVSFTVFQWKKFSFFFFFFHMFLAASLQQEGFRAFLMHSSPARSECPQWECSLC